MNFRPQSEMQVWSADRLAAVFTGASKATRHVCYRTVNRAHLQGVKSGASSSSQPLVRADWFSVPGLMAICTLTSSVAIAENEAPCTNTLE